MSETVSCASGTPCTITWKTFWSSKTLPTRRPLTSVASARRTSPGLIPSLSGLGDVDLDLHVRLLGGLPDDRVDDALDLRHERPHLGRLAAEDVQVLAVHADDERVVGPGPGQHVEALARSGVRAFSESPDVADLLIRIGDHVALHVLRLGKHVLDRRDGRVVVGIGGEADPDLAGVNVDALVAADGAPDGRRDGLDSGQ